MSKLYRNGAIAATVVGAAVFLLPRSEKPLETFASQNVANRMSAGGGTHTHTPAIATPRGKPDQTESPQLHSKGIDTQYFKDNHASQKVGAKTAPEKALNKTVYGQEQGK